MMTTQPSVSATSTLFSKRRLAAAFTGTLLSAALVTQASAMLPTPESELNNPSTVETAAIAQQNTRAATGNAAAVTSKITAALVSVDANGQETLAPVNANTRLQSGNVLEYHAYFTNTNKDRVRKMTVTVGIPEQVELLRVVSPEFPLGSVDGNTFARMPLQGVIDGTRQEIPLKFYKGVRWDIEGLGLNETTVVKYRAKVK